MIKIYTINNSNPSREMKEFLTRYNLEFSEQNVSKDVLTLEQLREIFRRADSIDDIISTRAKSYKGLKQLLDNEDTKISEVFSYILHNKSVLKYPITMDESKFLAGCGEDINVFIPKHIREQEIKKVLATV